MAGESAGVRRVGDSGIAQKLAASSSLAIVS
jgi:hypothetical protein